ncbi:MAG: DEAD/DEAH box helicase [Phycisphaerales bacterium]
MNLRDYQTTAVERAIEAFDSVRSALWVMPTGSGKTIAFADLTRRMESNGRAMVMAHRDELIRQAVNKLTLVTGHEPDVEKAEYWADQNLMGLAPVVVSSVQTLNAGMNGHGRMTRFHPERFGLFVIDEAHHATSPTYRKVQDHFNQNPNLKTLGCTATPDRADEEALGQVFDEVAFVYELIDAINDGWLVQIEQQYVQIDGLDFSECRTTAGDLNGGDLDAIMRFEKNLHGVVSPMLDIVGNRKTLIFATSVAHAERMCEIINRHKRDSACFIQHKTPKDDRRRILDDYRDGCFQFLCNVGIATEGFDDPSIEVIIMARPTKSRCLYAQMAGRGTRPLDEIVPFINDCEQAESRRTIISGSPKPSMLVIDFAGNSGRHKLVCTADILGGRESDEVLRRAQKRAKEAVGPTNMTAEILTARNELEQEAKARRQSIVAVSSYRTREISPFDVFDMTPERERGWHRGRMPSERMKQVLRKAKIDGVEGMTLTAAGQMIEELKRRWDNKLCTYAQAKKLAEFGEDGECTFEEASAKLDAIARNGWRALSA